MDAPPPSLGTASPVVGEEQCSGSLQPHHSTLAARRAAFDELHRINAALQAQHADALDAAQREVHRCRRGLANLAVARRRDWPAPLLPDSILQQLRSEVERTAS